MTLRMCCAEPDILFFGTHQGLELFFSDPDARKFVHGGGLVAYGMVPTRSSLNALDSASIFIRWLNAASLAGDPRQLTRTTMITATCGLGLLDPPSVAESFTLLHSIGKPVRTLA
jgi:hypothetical protein